MTTKTQTVAERMIAFIQDHGHDAYVDDQPGLHVKDVWTYDDENGEQQVGEEWSVITMSWNSVRNWLDY